MMKSPTTLLSLPDELLNEIFEELCYTSSDLLSSSLTCHRLRGVALQCLYHSLSVIRVGNIYSPWSVNPRNVDSRSVTFIIKIDRLLWSLSTNPSLRSHVRTLYADWELRDENDFVQRLLRLLSNVQAMYLSPPRTQGITDVEKYPKSMPIVSLRLHYQSLNLSLDPLQRQYQTRGILEGEPLDYDKLFRIMKRQSLQELELDYLAHWSITKPLYGTSRKGTSAVRHIILNHSGFFASGMKEMLTWPRELISFRLEVMLTVPNHWNRPRFSPGAIVDGLSQHSKSLEQLYFCGDWSCTDQGDGSVVGPLNRFTALKRLHIPIHWMVYCVGDPRLLGNVPSRNPTICDHLPPNLELLELFISGEDFLEPEIRYEKRMQPHMKQVVDWVAEIMERKGSQTPYLRRLEIRQSQWSLHSLFNDQLVERMSQAAKAAGVELVVGHLYHVIREPFCTQQS